MKTLVFLKTHFINDFVLNELEKLEDCDNKNHKTILFIDNHKNFLKTKKRGIQKITFRRYPVNCFILDEINYAESGLPYFTRDPKNTDFSKLMWYCCDYPIYIMRNTYPKYDYYWQIESDVYMNGESYKPFFEKFQENSSDLIIQQFLEQFNSDKDFGYKTPFDWVYYKKLKYSGIFPILRVSNKAAKFLNNRRLKLAKIFEKIKNDETNLWTYCEFFVPTELMLNNYKCEHLKELFVRILPKYDLEKDIPIDSPDYRLYHPVKSN